MIDDQLEFALSQLADGTLDAAERAALERRLAADPEARQLLAQYQALDATLRAATQPLPAVAWEESATRISAQIASESAPADGIGDTERHSLRIDFTPAPKRRLLMPALVSWGGWAVAASILLVVTIHQYAPQPSPPLASLPPARTNITISPGQSPAEPAGLAMIQGPAAEPAAGSALALVNIGPPAELADANSVDRYAEEVIFRQPRVVIGSGGDSAQDAPSSPYQR